MVEGEIIFFKRFSNFNFRKKKKKEMEKRKKRKKEGRVQFIFNYHILLHKPNNPTYHLFLIKKLVI